jgi:hypothetical protein
MLLKGNEMWRRRRLNHEADIDPSPDIPISNHVDERQEMLTGFMTLHLTHSVHHSGGVLVKIFLVLRSVSFFKQ